ncbi:hypothetical protein EON65_28655 [archaeon]|nr:MAG: hypothetical protein EON65_28655 [archaeon]
MRCRNTRKSPPTPSTVTISISGSSTSSMHMVMQLYYYVYLYRFICFCSFVCYFPYRFSNNFRTIINTMDVGIVEDFHLVLEDSSLTELLRERLTKLEYLKFFYVLDQLTNPKAAEGISHSSADGRSLSLQPNFPPQPPLNAVQHAGEENVRKLANAEVQKRIQQLEQQEQRKASIQALELQLTQISSLDMVFVLDCTGSMGMYIGDTKNNITAFVTKVQASHPSVTVRLAFVGYRDYTEMDRIALMGFTTSIEEFKCTVANQVAHGGGDDAEDVIGALQMASTLDWNSATRILYLIGDSPCHGSEFHDSRCTDFYPDGDPHLHKVEDILKKLRSDNVQMFFGKIRGDRTDIMIQKFNELVGPPTYIYETPMNGGNMMRIITKTVLETMSSHLSQSGRVDSHRKFDTKDIDLERSAPNFKDLPLEQVMKYPMILPGSIEQLMDEQQDKCVNDFPDSSVLTVQLAPKPFAKGGLRLAFYGKLLDIDEDSKEFFKDIVFKEAIKHRDKEKAKVLTKHDYEKFLVCHRAAKFLANEFNRVRPVNCPSIHYVEAHIVQMNQRWPDQPIMIYEEAITSAWEKYNNNTGYVATNPTDKHGTSHEAVQAFSHWTHCVTNWKLMVVDCQGGYDHVRRCFMLTDPAVHCSANLRFGRTNLSEKGFGKFYSTHRCNDFCRVMNLSIPAAVLQKSS